MRRELTEAEENALFEEADRLVRRNAALRRRRNVLRSQQHNMEVAIRWIEADIEEINRTFKGYEPKSKKQRASHAPSLARKD